MGPVVAAGIGEEERLESIIAHDVEILGLGSLMLLGRQVITDHGSRIATSSPAYRIASNVLRFDERDVAVWLEQRRVSRPLPTRDR
jgi:hypothetical protein